MRAAAAVVIASESMCVCVCASLSKQAHGARTVVIDIERIELRENVIDVVLLYYVPVHAHRHARTHALPFFHRFLQSVSRNRLQARQHGGAPGHISSIVSVFPRSRSGASYARPFLSYPGPPERHAKIRVVGGVI